MMHYKEDKILKIKDLNVAVEKKTWSMPDLILIDKKVIESGRNRSSSEFLNTGPVS